MRLRINYEVDTVSDYLSVKIGFITEIKTFWKNISDMMHSFEFKKGFE